MSEWKTYRLGDICTFVAGFAFKSKDFGNYPDKVIKIADIQPPIVDMSSLTGIDISQYSSQKLEKYKTEKGDYVLAMTGATIGKLGRIVSEKKAYINQRVLLFKPIDKYIDKNYLYYYLCQNTFFSHIRNHIDSETAQPNISANSIGEFTLTLPSLDEQRRIVGILGSLDDKIELNRRINANLEAQAQALFKSWFVDFEPFRNDPFVDSELGKIPQGWKVGNYTDIVEIKGGGTPKTGIQEYWNGTIPFFSPKDVGTSCFVLDTEKHITAKGLENCNSSLFQPNTVFITARGTVGKVVMTGTEMAMNQTNYALLGKHNISQYYVYHITLQLVARLLKKANGAVFNAITTRDFTSEQIVIPPFSTIRQFSDVVKPIYKNILLNDIQSNHLSSLRDTLLSKLMAGEINID